MEALLKLARLERRIALVLAIIATTGIALVVLAGETATGGHLVTSAGWSGALAGSCFILCLAVGCAASGRSLKLVALTRGQKAAGWLATAVLLLSVGAGILATYCTVVLCLALLIISGL